jgi:hypothetical protein
LSITTRGATIPTAVPNAAISAESFVIEVARDCHLVVNHAPQVSRGGGGDGRNNVIAALAAWEGGRLRRAEWWSLPHVRPLAAVAGSLLAPVILPDCWRSSPDHRRVRDERPARLPLVVLSLLVISGHAMVGFAVGLRIRSSWRPRAFSSAPLARCVSWRIEASVDVVTLVPTSLSNRDLATKYWIFVWGAWALAKPDVASGQPVAFALPLLLFFVVSLVASREPKAQPARRFADGRSAALGSKAST